MASPDQIVEENRRPSVPARRPAIPTGWTTGPPDFVGVGVQRAGTTWWFGLIERHPTVSIAPGARKELHFFDVFFESGFSDDDVARYHSYFPRPDGSLTGEWTPPYMWQVWTPPLLAACAPEAKLLVMLRDPLARYRSQVARSATKMEERGFSGSAHRAQFYGNLHGLALSRSLYFEQLRRLLKHFSREQVLLLQFERCVEDPASQLRRTYEFIGLEDVEFVPNTISNAVNVGVSGYKFPRNLEREVTVALSNDARRLLDLEPTLDIGLWPSVTGGSESVGSDLDQSRRLR